MQGDNKMMNEHYTLSEHCSKTQAKNVQNRYTYHAYTGTLASLVWKRHFNKGLCCLTPLSTIFQFQ